VLAPVGKILYVKPAQTVPLEAIIVGEAIIATVLIAGELVFEGQPSELVPTAE
jgi:hypothetical protein